METSPWLRLMTVGLVLAALAVGYFLLTGKLSSNSTKKQSIPPSSVLGQNVQATPTPSPVSSPTSASAYQRIVSRNQGNVQTLPKTGFPVELAVIFSASAIISGWGLRQFPK